jgi:GT2 family glycosyltransferase
MRLGYTIVLNGLHHLLRNDYAEQILKSFDYWAVCEGATAPNGSTSWMQPVSPLLQHNGHSTDGTLQYLKDLQKRYPNLILITRDGTWRSKDDMCNACLEKLRKHAPGYLWQIDSDEYMVPAQRDAAEGELLEHGVLRFRFFHRVANRTAIGPWGGNTFLRLWNWRGEKLLTHEPPALEGGWPEKTSGLVKFDHFSYENDLDVIFKDQTYTHYKGLYQKWKKLRYMAEEEEVPLSFLFGEDPKDSLLRKRVGQTKLMTERKSAVSITEKSVFQVKFTAACKVLSQLGHDLEKYQDTEEYLEWLFQLSQYRNLRYLEMGSTGGAAAFLVAYLNPSFTVCGMDPSTKFTESWQKLRFEARRAGARLQFLSLNYEEVATKISGQFDVIFVDGDHRRQGVIRDLHTAQLMLSTEHLGLVAIHDAKRKIRPNWVGYVWDELEQQGPLHFVISKRDDGMGIGVLKFTTPMQEMSPDNVTPEMFRQGRLIRMTVADSRYPFYPDVVSRPDALLRTLTDQPAATDKGNLLFIINGGLGDGASLTYTLVAAHKLGYIVHILPTESNAGMMRHFWAMLPDIKVVDRVAAQTFHYKAVCCSTRTDVLQKRAEGLSYDLLINGRPTAGSVLAETHLHLLQQLGHTDVKLDLWPLQDHRPLTKEQEVLLIAPGVGPREENQLKLYSRWPEVIRQLPSDLPIVLIGDKASRKDWVDTIKDLPNVTDMLGQTTQITDLIKLFGKARLIVGPDNGLGHLAALFGVHTLSLFNSATDPKLFRPYNGEIGTVLLDLNPNSVVAAINKALNPLVQKVTPVSKEITACPSGSYLSILNSLGYAVDLVQRNSTASTWAGELCERLTPGQKLSSLVVGPKNVTVIAAKAGGYSKWVETIRYLPRPVVIIGDKDAEAPWVKEALKIGEVTSSIGKLNRADEYLALFRKTQIVLTDGTWQGQLAAMFDIPVVLTTSTPIGSKSMIVMEDQRPGVIANGFHIATMRKLGIPPECPEKLSKRKISIIITTFNEGDEVFLTCDSAYRNAGCDAEIIVVDDASTDGSCDHLPDYVKVIKREKKYGVASSRNVGVQHATGDALMFLDAHQRVGPGTPAKMMKASFEKQALIVPGVIPLYSPQRGGSWACGWSMEKNRLRSRWLGAKPSTEFATTNSFVAPGWCLTRELWNKLGPWPSTLSNWGSTEVCKSVQCFMAGIPLLTMRDAETWHRFRSRFPYPVQTAGIWYNAYVVARVMFGEKVFRSFFLPKMKPEHWDEKIAQMLESPGVEQEAEFYAKLRKVDPQTFVDKFLMGNQPSPDAEVRELLPQLSDAPPPQAVTVPVTTTPIEAVTIVTALPRSVLIDEPVVGMAIPIPEKQLQKSAVEPLWQQLMRTALTLIDMAEELRKQQP